MYRVGMKGDNSGTMEGSSKMNIKIYCIKLDNFIVLKILLSFQ